jgi:5-methylcytosine-specific restriction endonuclease McrA
MPTRVKTFCVNGCTGKGVNGSRLCTTCYNKREVHNAQAKELAEQKRVRFEGNASQRGYDWAWAKVSKYVRTNEPVCRHCKNALATMVDHIKPLKQGGDRLALNNLQPLCHSCHATKTAKETQQQRAT